MDKGLKSIYESFMVPFTPETPKSSLLPIYPAQRDHFLATPQKWLEGKREDDNLGDLWRVHDKIYDFQSFVTSHPGGKDWLQLTKGTDITEAFEAHHISTTPEKLLEKFYVREATTPRNSPFTFREDGFYRTLKRNVREIIHTIPKSSNAKSKIFADGLFLSYLLLAFLSAYYVSYTFAVLAGIMLSMTTIAAHNFFHQRDNFRMYYFDFSTMSSRGWRVTHALSHHIYTNTLYDFEIRFVEPWFQFLPVKKHFFWRYLPWFYHPLVYLLGLPMFYVRMIIQLGMDKGRSFEWASLLPFTILGLMSAISTAAFVKVCILFAVIILTSSMHFVIVGINAAHHHPDIFHDGDAPRGDLDWGLHEIDAVADREDINWSDFLVLTHFGDHCLHHLFPTLDHGKLKFLYPVLYKTCKDFGVDIRITKQLDLIIGQYAQLARITPRKKSTHQ